MHQKVKRYIYLVPAVLIMAGIFFSCVNDLDDVIRISQSSTAPVQASKDLHVIYTDSGIAKVEIYATIAEIYKHPVKVTKFKHGLKVNFFNEQGEIQSVLTSNYGQVNDSTGNMLAKDSVRLFNVEQNKTLETSILHWNKKKDSIYTQKPVAITTDKMVLHGIGAWTTSSFDTAQVFRPTGLIYQNNNK